MTAPIGASSAPSWMVGGNVSSGDRIDAAFGGGSLGVRGGWRPSYDEGSQPGVYYFSREADQQPDHDHLPYTPLMSRRAAAFAATDVYSETRTNTLPFLTEVAHAVGVYEFSMKAINGTLSPQGATINRYG
jgi:hypothetical protein